MPHAQTTSKRANRRERLEVASSAFTNGGAISARYTSDGIDVSPPLRWTDPHAATRTFAIICEDADAPSGLFTHWLAWNIRGDKRDLKEDIAHTAESTDELQQGLNGFGQVGYCGPRPPQGESHRYYFRVFSLDAGLDVPAGATRAMLERAMDGHVLDEGSLMAKYGR